MAGRQVPTFVDMLYLFLHTELSGDLPVLISSCRPMFQLHKGGYFFSVVLQDGIT